MQEPLVTRAIPASAKRIFEAWISPKKLSAWELGEYSVPFASITIEPHAGGRYDYCLVEKVTKKEYWLRNKILTFTPNKLLVLELEPMPEQGYHTPVITRFEFIEENTNSTRLIFYRAYPPERRRSAQPSWENAIDSMTKLILKETTPTEPTRPTV